MTLIYCDHCGKKISLFETHEITSSTALWDPENQTHLGLDHDLCENCWNERIRLHLRLDREFLHLDEENN